MKKSNRRLLPDPQVCARYGIHSSTLRNWDLNSALKFPKPIRINNRKFRDEEELEAFDRARADERDASEAA
jgi:predicted DNA-binding transcriptional regulator AlpA